MKPVVVHIITMLELGGAQQNTLYTCEHLNRERFTVKLLAGPGGILDKEAKAINDLEFRSVERLVRKVSPPKDALALWELTLYFKQLRANTRAPIIIHTHSSKAGVLGRTAAAAAGLKHVIHSIHGFGFSASQLPFMRKGFEAAEKVAAHYTAHFIAVSENNRRMGIKMGLFTEENSTLIRSGIKLSEFILTEDEKKEARKAIRAELGIAKNKTVVVMAACLKPQKAPVDFVEAARLAIRQNSNLVFLICGDGELRDDVQRALSRGGLINSFRMLGWRRDMPKIFAASDIMALTSRWEGLPRVIPQAMCAKLPIVATNVDGIPEALIHGKNGFLCAPGDITGIAEGIVRLSKSPTMRKNFGEEGFSRVDEWDIDAMVRKQERLYEKIIGAHP